MTEDSTSLDALEIEQTLFTDDNTWFYQVAPSLISSDVPSADKWNIHNPLMTGILQIVQVGDEAFIRLYEPQKSDCKQDEMAKRVLFAECPLRISDSCLLHDLVQECSDSSRYFMIRVEDRVSKRRAYISAGFSDRSKAFSFKACLADYTKYKLRQMKTQRGSVVLVGEEPRVNSYKLPENASIHINLRNKSDEKGKEILGAEVALGRTLIVKDDGTGLSGSNRDRCKIPPPPNCSSIPDKESWGDFMGA